MGKTVVVSSSVYNMAGDEDDRPNFLKSTLFSAVMNDHQDVYLGETLVSNYLNGPGIKQRSLYNYCVRKDYAGLPELTISSQTPVAASEVEPFITIPSSPAGLVLQIQDSYLTDGDYEVFAEKWILDNKPEMILDDWTAEYFSEDHIIIVQYANGDTDTIPGGSYSASKQFVIAHYYLFVPDSVEDLVEGVMVVDALVADLPDVSGASLVQTTNEPLFDHLITYEKTVDVTYSDATPSTSTVTTENETVPFAPSKADYTESRYIGGNGTSSSTTTREYFTYIFERRKIIQDTTSTVITEDMGGGVTRTTTTTKIGDHLVPQWDYQEDYQDTLTTKIEGIDKVFTYKIGGTNTALNALANTTEPVTQEFYPFIPLRLNNKSINDPRFDDDTGNGLFTESKNVYRRATSGESFQDLIDQVEDNEDLNEIDYAYVQYGVSLNVKENACRKYLYNFFKSMIPYQNVSSGYMNAYMAQVGDYNAANLLLEAWTLAQNEPENPLYNTAKPVTPKLSRPEVTTINIRTSDPSLKDFDTRIYWMSIDEELHTGKAAIGVKVGEVFLTSSAARDEGTVWDTDIGVLNILGGSSRKLHGEADKTTIFWQTGEDTYKTITIWGLVFKNYIYGGKHVYINASEAMTDADITGFIIPLHAPTVRAMSIVDATQMATANTYIVFNSYKVYKKKWYQTFVGMLFIFTVLLVGAAIIAPAALGGATGLLGTNAAVGAGLGLTGTAGIVAGALVNTLAATIVAKMISGVSVAIFGEKWGALIGAIASFAVNFGMANGFANFNMTTMMNPQNLLSMSSALANGYAGMVQANILAIQSEMESNTTKYDEQMDEINQLMKELNPGNDLFFDPMQLTDVSAGNGQGTGGMFTPEGLDDFIHRTTMTGSDIVEVTISMVTDFTSLSLTLPEGS